MNLDVTKWGQFKIGDLFPILQNGKANQGMLSDGNDCFYVGAKKDDNGVMLHCAYDEELIQKGNCIIFICNGQGSVGYANYMDVDFIGTTDIVAGYNENLNEYNGLFIATILCRERPKYSFGRKWKTHLRETKIRLPQTIDQKPDWVFMDEYIKSLKRKPLTTCNRKSEVLSLNVEEWGNFRIGDLFNIYKGNSLTTDDKDAYEGDIPCVNGTAENNGIMCYLDRRITEKGFTFFKAPCLTLSRVGNSGKTFLQSADFFVADNAFALQLKESNNKFVYLFLSAILNQEIFKYSYGRTVTIEKYLNKNIRLPQKADGSPNYEYMESYIKSLSYGDRI